MKKIFLIVCIVCACFSLFSCNAPEDFIPTEDTVCGTYVWEKEGFGSPFTITLKADGSCSYYIGMLSSHIGLGSWSLADGIVTMKENENGLGQTNLFHFRVEADALIFIDDASDAFQAVGVSDGDRFSRTTDDDLYVEL